MISNGYQFVYFRPHNDKTNLSLAIIVYQILSPYFSPQELFTLLMFFNVNY